MSKRVLVPATTWPTIVGRVLIHERDKHGLHQSQLAAMVGVTQSTWSRIERGESALTVDQLALAASALRIMPEEIIRRSSVVQAYVRQRGICVEPTRNSSANNTKLVLIDAVALSDFVVAALVDMHALRQKKQSQHR